MQVETLSLQTAAEKQEYQIKAAFGLCMVKNVLISHPKSQCFCQAEENLNLKASFQSKHRRDNSRCSNPFSFLL